MQGSNLLRLFKRWEWLLSGLLIAAAFLALSSVSLVRAHEEHYLVRVSLERTTWFNCADGFFGGPPDIYFNVDIDGIRHSSIRRPITSNFSPFEVNRVFEQEVEFSKETIPIVIEQWDADDNPDDQCDLKRGRGKSLLLNLDLSACVITGDVSGTCSTPIIAQFEPPFQDNFIEFTVTVEKPSGPPGPVEPELRDITTRAWQCRDLLARNQWDVTGNVNPGLGPGVISLYTGDSWWAYGTPMSNTQDCENFAFLRVSSSGPGSFLIVPQWPTNPNFPIDPVHCFVFNPNEPLERQHQHTYINYAVFIRAASQPAWQLVSAGVLVGQEFPDRGCVFAIDGNPAQIVARTVIVPGDEGSNVARFRLSTAGEIAIIQQNYGHDFRESCGEQVCLYPVRVNVHFRR